MPVSEADRRRARRELSEKLELEKALRGPVRSAARLVSRVLAYSAGRGRPVPDLGALHQALLEGPVHRVRERAVRRFGRRLREQMGPDSRAFAFEDALLDSLGWRTWEGSQAQAREAGRTTGKQAARALEVARQEAERMRAEGEAVGLPDQGAMAGRILLRLLLGRTEGIVVFAVQSAVEGAKQRELEVLMDRPETPEAKALRDSEAVKEWVSQGDSRVRPAHIDADGIQVGVDEPFRVGGEHLMYPGDRSLGASLGNVIGCRCSAAHDVEAVASARQDATDERCAAAAAARSIRILGRPLVGLETKAPKRCPFTQTEEAAARTRLAREIEKTEASIARNREKIASLEKEIEESRVKLRGTMAPADYQKLRTSQGTRLGIARKNLEKGEARLAELKKELAALRRVPAPAPPPAAAVVDEVLPTPAAPPPAPLTGPRVPERTIAPPVTGRPTAAKDFQEEVLQSWDELTETTKELLSARRGANGVSVKLKINKSQQGSIFHWSWLGSDVLEETIEISQRGFLHTGRSTFFHEAGHAVDLRLGNATHSPHHSWARRSKAFKEAWEADIAEIGRDRRLRYFSNTDTTKLRNRSMEEAFAEGFSVLMTGVSPSNASRLEYFAGKFTRTLEVMRRELTKEGILR